MKTLLKISMILIMVNIINGCGAPVDREMPLPNKEYKVPLENQVHGRLKNVVKIPEQDFELKVSIDSGYSGKDYSIEAEIIVDFFKSKKIPAGVEYNRFGPNLEIVLLDKNDQRVSHLNCSNSHEEISKMIRIADGKSKIKFSSNSLVWANFTKDETLPELEKCFKALYNLEIVSKAIITSEIIPEKFETKSSSTSSSSGSDCDEALSGYKEFMKEYIEIISEYGQDKDNKKLIKKYNKLALQNLEWAEKLNACSDDIEFNQKVLKLYAEIATEVAKYQ